MFPMDLGIPILLKAYGNIQQTDIDKKLFVYKSFKEALSLFDEIINKIETGILNRKVSESTNNFLLPHISENRRKELDNIFLPLLK